MCNKDSMEDLDKLISCVDSFQQDNGELRYQFTMHSYAQRHKIIVSIFKSDKVTHKSKAVTFCVDDFRYLYETFERYTHKLYEEA
jgi:hypothetical protein